MDQIINTAVDVPVHRERDFSLPQFNSRFLDIRISQIDLTS